LIIIYLKVLNMKKLAYLFVMIAGMTLAVVNVNAKDPKSSSTTVKKEATTTCCKKGAASTCANKDANMTCTKDKKGTCCKAKTEPASVAKGTNPAK
jgi:hypothetical protein